VKEQMDEAARQGKRENWSQAQYHDTLRGIIAENRQELRKGNISLNCIHRPWANKP
jgi:hypothetical protein